MRRLALTLFLAGCAFRPSGIDVPSASGDLAQHPLSDLGTPVAPDLTVAHALHDLAQPVVTDLTPPADLVPSYHYRDTIQGILDARGCTASTCHQAYKPLVLPTPHSTAQWQQNYDNAVVDVALSCDMGTPLGCSKSSLLLTKPLVGSGVDHAGGVKPFLSTADVDYQTLLIWIEEGARL